MSKQTQDQVGGWLRANLWNLIITTVIIIVAFVTLQTKVVALELQTKILEDKVAQYPAQEYFDLRFSTIEARQVELKSEIVEVKQDVKSYIDTKQTK